MKLKRVLALLLVLCLSVSVLALPTYAAEDDHTFSSFNELKELVKKYENSTGYNSFYYDGTKTLVISEDITIPASMGISCTLQPVTVSKGVTLNVTEGMDAGTMTIDGTANIPYLTIIDSLTVNGTLNCSGQIYLYYLNTKLSGEQNIKLGDDTRINYSCDVGTLDALLEAIDTATADTNRKHSYDIFAFNEFNEITINKSLTLLSNTNITIASPLTVEKDCTLTINGIAGTMQPLTVNGSLVNNNVLYVESHADRNGTLTIADGGSYSGNGNICVWSPDIDDPFEVLSGINVKDFNATYSEEYTEWVLTPKKETEVAVTAPKVTAKNTASSGKVKLSWKAVDGAENYIVYRATSKDGKYSKLKTTTATSYTDSSAKVGITYYYKVKAVGASSSNTATSSAVKGVRDLAQPTVTAKNTASTGKTKLSWKAIDGAEKYVVYRATSKNGEYAKVKATTATSYTDSSAKVGKTYYYKVTAVHEKSAANSAKSAAVSAVRDLAQPSVSVTVKSNGDPKVSWKEVDGATKYYVYRATSKSGEYTKVKSTTKLSFTDTTAKAGKTYYYKVKAIHSTSAANSAASAVVKAKAK